MAIYRIVADVVVLVHLTYVAFVVLAALAILVGMVFHWQWVRNFWFRAIHLAMVAVVVIQSVLGILCPLTTLENYLRRQAGAADYPGSFVGYWAHELVFIDAPPWAFTVVYCLFGSLVLGAIFLVPPRQLSWRKGAH
jgi:hypothetical protein